MESSATFAVVDKGLKHQFEFPGHSNSLEKVCSVSYTSADPSLELSIRHVGMYDTVTTVKLKGNMSNRLFVHRAC